MARLLALLLSIAWPCAGAAQDMLRVLVWPGYADTDIVQAFERQTSSRVELTTVDSDEALWRHMTSAGNMPFDVLAVNTAELQRFIQRDLVQPINTAAVPNRSRQLARFRDVEHIPGLVHNGKVYAIPYTYAEMGLIYDRKQFSKAPDSISILWDPRLQGKVLAYDGGSHNFSLAAVSLEHPTPFALDKNDWPQLVERLIDLRRNVLSFYTQPQESVDLFIRRGASVLFANFGSQQVRLLQAAGADIGYVIPREGALAWLDCWAITRDTKHPKLAAEWINFMLEDAPGEALRSRHGLASTTRPAPGAGVSDRLIWLEPVENAEYRNLLWRRIMSGTRPAKVLTP